MVAREVAQKSMVLLKNNNHTLPLKKDVKTIFVAGPYAADTYDDGELLRRVAPI